MKVYQSVCLRKNNSGTKTKISIFEGFVANLVIFLLTKLKTSKLFHLWPKRSILGGQK